MTELNLAVGKELELKEKVRQQVVAGDLTLFNLVKDIYGFKIEEFVTDMNSVSVKIVVYTTLPKEYIDSAVIAQYFSDQLSIPDIEDALKDKAYSKATLDAEYDEEEDDIVYDNIYGSFFNIEFQVES